MCRDPASTPGSTARPAPASSTTPSSSWRSRQASRLAIGSMARAASGVMSWRKGWPAGFDPDRTADADQCLVNGLRARPRRRGKPKDDGERSVIADNILDRDFQADRPNQNGELLFFAEDRTHGPQGLSHPKLSTCRCLRLHRTLLQPASAALETGLHQPHGVQGPHYASLTCCP